MPTPHKAYYSLNKKIIIGVIVIIAPILGLIFFWIEANLLKQAKVQTLEKARVIADYVILTRQWITDCNGGVFVPAKSDGAQNIRFEEMEYVLNCQVKTPTGILQMFTPSMVTKKLSEYSSANKSYSMKLSSLNPINPENMADPFERRALIHFEKNSANEFYNFSNQHCDFMVPLHSTRGCLKCHEDFDVINAGVVGGLRVTVPYDETRKILRQNAMILGGSSFGIIAIIIAFLIFMINKVVLSPLKVLEETGRQISSGNLSARVSINTRDELEFLGHNFNTMASTLEKNHEQQEKKITLATQDLAKANKELLKLDKLKSDFLANMSHELRSPLTAARGGVNYLERTIQNPHAFQYLSIVEKNLARLTWMINNLFDYTKLEAGKIEWEFQKENITTLVEEVIEIMSPVAMKKKITVDLTYPGDIYSCIDLERMEQVFVNILDNAIKFSDEGTAISICLEKKTDHVRVSIKDQGPGIKDNLFDNIFEKFYTGESSQPNKGSGMGLAISKAIVSAHHGEITLKSELGKGACFEVILPFFQVL